MGNTMFIQFFYPLEFQLGFAFLFLLVELLEIADKPLDILPELASVLD